MILEEEEVLAVMVEPLATAYLAGVDGKDLSLSNYVSLSWLSALYRYRYSSLRFFITLDKRNGFSIDFRVLPHDFFENQTWVEVLVS